MPEHNKQPHRIKLAPSAGWQWSSPPESPHQLEAIRSFQGTAGLLEAANVRIFFRSPEPVCCIELNDESILERSECTSHDVQVIGLLQARNRISLRWCCSDRAIASLQTIPFELWIEIDT